MQIKGSLSKSLKQVSDPSLPLCWKGQKAFKSVSDVKKDFKSLQFIFGKNAVMDIPPENYLIITVSIRRFYWQLEMNYFFLLKMMAKFFFLCMWQKNGNVCLGILDGSAAKLSFSIIGGTKFRYHRLFLKFGHHASLCNQCFLPFCRHYNAGSDGDIW